MMNEEGWIERTVQEYGGGYPRITFPPSSFLDDFLKEDVRIKETGGYWIVRPPEEDLGKTGIVYLTDNSLERGLERDRLEDVVLCYCIAGAEQIEVELSRLSDEAKQNIEGICRELENPPLLKWDAEEFTFEAGTELGVDEHIERVQRFINNRFMDLLTVDVGDNLDFEEREMGEIEAKKSLAGRDIDLYWALSTRNLVRKIFEAQKAELPQALGWLYIGKHLEILGDRVQHCFTLLTSFYNNVDPEIGGIVQDSLYGIFRNPVRYDEQVEEIAMESFEGNIGIPDVNQQEDIRKDRRKKLNELPDTIIKKENLDTPAPEDLVRLGRVIAECRRLTRFPRSMALVGLGIHYTSKIHDLDD